MTVAPSLSVVLAFSETDPKHLKSDSYEKSEGTKGALILSKIALFNQNLKYILRYFKDFQKYMMISDPRQNKVKL